MATVYGIVEILLRPGVRGEDFERFINDEWAKLVPMQGTQVRVLKGDRGNREGRYLFMNEYESVEARNRYSPEPDVNSEELKNLPGAAKAGAKWQSMVSRHIYTDYVVVD